MRNKTEKSSYVKGAKAVFYVEPSTDVEIEDGAIQEVVGPFETLEEADAAAEKAYEDWGGEKTELHLEPYDRPEHPYVVTYFEAPLRDLVRLEDLPIARRLVEDLTDCIYNQLALNFKGGAVEVENLTKTELVGDFSLDDDALRRICGKVADALRAEGVDVSEEIARWWEDQ